LLPAASAANAAQATNAAMAASVAGDNDLIFFFFVGCGALVS
jgi:hypothetical protein